MLLCINLPFACLRPPYHEKPRIKEGRNLGHHIPLNRPNLQNHEILRIGRSDIADPDSHHQSI